MGLSDYGQCSNGGKWHFVDHSRSTETVWAGKALCGVTLVSVGVRLDTLRATGAAWLRANICRRCRPWITKDRSQWD